MGLIDEKKSPPWAAVETELRGSFIFFSSGDDAWETVALDLLLSKLYIQSTIKPQMNILAFYSAPWFPIWEI